MPNDYLPVPHYKQSADGQCLPACVRMVLAYLGHDLTESRIARLLRARTFGTPASNIRYVETLNVSVQYGPLPLFKLRTYLQNHTPCIVFVQAADLPYAYVPGFHALVVIGIDEEMVYLNDPAFEPNPHAVPLDYFMLAWSEFDYQAAVITERKDEG
ncbi:MAG: peptidase C39 family protein [Anaerolineae bacterium]|nr:peptidase C39 family protein [Anaerolineae bacterium]